MISIGIFDYTPPDDHLDKDIAIAKTLAEQFPNTWGPIVKILSRRAPGRPETLLGYTRSGPDNCSKSVAETPTSERVRQATTYLQTAQVAVQGAGGDSQTYEIARDLVRGFALDEETALDLITKIYNPRCLPEWGEAALGHKINSAVNADAPQYGSLLAAHEAIHQDPFGRLCHQADIQDVDAWGIEFAKGMADDFEDDAMTAIDNAFDPDTVEWLAAYSISYGVGYQQLMHRLGGLAKPKKNLDRLERTVKTRARELRSELERERRADRDVQSGMRVHDVLPDAPVCENAVIPDGWEINLDGIAKWNPKTGTTDLVAPEPILIVGRLIDVANDEEHWRLAFPRDGKWRKITKPRVVCARRSLVDLSSSGAPVNEHNVMAMVEFLSAYEYVNLDHLPVAKVTSHMGWQDATSFVLGETLISANNSDAGAIDFDELPPEKWQRDMISFCSPSEGHADIAKGFHSKGSREEWVELLRSIQSHPGIAVAPYIALSSVMLHVLQTNGFNVEWAGTTSQGKTTAIEVGASAYGNPDQRSTPSIVYGWDNTETWIERTATLLSSLPVVLDDTRTAKDPDRISNVLYTIPNGKGRGRGSIKGIRATGTWRTILMSTAEEASVRISQKGGAEARTITIMGSPFTVSGEQGRALAAKVRRATYDNYGVAAPVFIRGLIQRNGEWPQWREEHRELEQLFQRDAGDNNYAGRLATAMATICVTAQRAHEILGLDWAPDATLWWLWNRIKAEVADADRGEAALRWTLTWAVAQGRHFYAKRSKEPGPLAGIDGRVQSARYGWLGRHDGEGAFLAIFPQPLRDTLEDRGFNYDATVRTWRDRGWIKPAKPSRMTKQVRLDNREKPQLIYIPVKVVKSAAKGGKISAIDADKVD